PRRRGHRSHGEGVRDSGGADASRRRRGLAQRRHRARLGVRARHEHQPARGAPEPPASKDRPGPTCAADRHRSRTELHDRCRRVLMRLILRSGVFLRHVVAVGLILALAALGGDWIFSRMVLGEFDESLRELAQSEAEAAIARPVLPPRIHEVSFGTAPPSFPRLDKFIQIVSLDGRPVARSVNLGNAQLPTPPLVLSRLRAGEEVVETLRDFADEPVRLLSVPLEIGGKAYAIQVAGSLDDATSAIRSARRLFLAMSAAIVAAVALTGAMLARAILVPIDHIVRRARVIGAAGLAERLPHPGSGDEMARLVETL